MAAKLITLATDDATASARREIWASGSPFSSRNTCMRTTERTNVRLAGL